MKYWLMIDGRSLGPLGKEEVIRQYGRRITAETECCPVGENQWAPAINFFPELFGPEREEVLGSSSWSNDVQEDAGSPDNSSWEDNRPQSAYQKERWILLILFWGGLLAVVIRELPLMFAAGHPLLAFFRMALGCLLVIFARGVFSAFFDIADKVRSLNEQRIEAGKAGQDD